MHLGEPEEAERSAVAGLHLRRPLPPHLVLVAVVVAMLFAPVDVTLLGAALERIAGNTYGIVLGLECLGQVRLARGDLAGAREALTEGIGLSRELGLEQLARDVRTLTIPDGTPGILQLIQGRELTGIDPFRG